MFEECTYVSLSLIFRMNYVIYHSKNERQSNYLLDIVVNMYMYANNDLERVFCTCLKFVCFDNIFNITLALILVDKKCLLGRWQDICLY